MIVSTPLVFTKGSRSRRNSLGLSLLACMLLGGGTGRGLLVDGLLQCLVIASSGYALWNGTWTRAARYGAGLLALTTLMVLIQLIPLPVSFIEIFRPEALLPFNSSGSLQLAIGTISLSASRTLEAGIFVIVPLLFFTALVSMPNGTAISLLPFFMIGLCCNLVAAGLQYSFSGNTNLGNLIGFEVMVGMFANRNHFTTLLLSSIPLLVYFGIFQGRLLVSAILISFIFLILLATGSRAGILIGLSLIIFSVVLLLWRRHLSLLALVIIFVVILTFIYAASLNVEMRDLDPDFGRLEFAKTTLLALKQNWVLGTGLGTFDLVYPYYENSSMIFAEYVNHAHNDFLEVALEAGVLGILIFLVYLALMFVRIRNVGNMPLVRLVLLSILVVFLHSQVDYPMRTMAVIMIFSYLNAMFFSDLKKSIVNTPDRC